MTKKTAVDCADSKYDSLKNYNHIREQGSIPIIDYNKRNEKLSKDDLLKRGYDEQGMPFAPCGLLTTPNGFDEKRQRLTFCCFKQCQKLTAKALEELHADYDLATCPYIANETGYTKHQRASPADKRHPQGNYKISGNQTAPLRPERESTAPTRKIRPSLGNPRVLNANRAAILAQMTAIVVLLKRALSFVIKITYLFRKYMQETNAETKARLELLLRPPKVPTFIMKLIQRE